MSARGKPYAGPFDPPGSRYGDPADFTRSERLWRSYVERIDREDAKAGRAPMKKSMEPEPEQE